MRPMLLAGAFFLLLGFTFHQIGSAISLSNESLIRGALVSKLSVLPACNILLANPILLQLLGGVAIFTGTLLCASSLTVTNDKTKPIPPQH